MGDTLQRGAHILHAFSPDMVPPEGAALVPMNIIPFLSHGRQQGREGENIP